MFIDMRTEHSSVVASALVRVSQTEAQCKAMQRAADQNDNHSREKVQQSQLQHCFLFLLLASACLLMHMLALKLDTYYGSLHAESKQHMLSSPDTDTA